MKGGYLTAAVFLASLFVIGFVNLSPAVAAGIDDFVIEVKTDNDGDSDDDQFTIPTYSGETYHYNIDCNNDGIHEDTAQTGDYTCDYDEAGTYTIRIENNFVEGNGFPRIHFNDAGDEEKLLKIKQWGDGQWSSMAQAFRGASNLQITATDTPDTSLVTSFDYMFNDAANVNINVSDWDVSSATSMVATFANATSFDQDLSDWDVSNVTSMTAMLSGVTLSTENYDNTLQAWSERDLQTGVTFGAGNSKYCVAEKARDNLTSSDVHNWTVSDNGQLCNPSIAYSGNFTETTANTGVVSGSRIATLTEDIFANAGSMLTLNTHYTVSNIPAGLTPIMTVNSSGTAATLTLSGSATQHSSNNSIANFTVTFLDAAFTIATTAEDVSGTSNAAGSIDFIDAPINTTDNSTTDSTADTETTVTKKIQSCTFNKSNRTILVNYTDGTQATLKPFTNNRIFRIAEDRSDDAEHVEYILVTDGKRLYTYNSNLQLTKQKKIRNKRKLKHFKLKFIDEEFAIIAGARGKNAQVTAVRVVDGEIKKKQTKRFKLKRKVTKPKQVKLKVKKNIIVNVRKSKRTYKLTNKKKLKRKK